MHHPSGRMLCPYDSPSLNTRMVQYSRQCWYHWIATVRSTKKGPVNICLSIARHTVQPAGKNNVSTTLYGFSGAHNLKVCLFTNPARWTVKGGTALPHKRYAFPIELTLQLLVDCSDPMRLFNFVRTRQIPSQDGVPLMFYS
jgi:hypothetical protein